jgi:hypothetical protein
MLIARENMQFAIHATAEDGFRQHALDGELQDALRMLLEELLKRDRLDSANGAGVVVVDLVGEFRTFTCSALTTTM